MAEDPGVGGAMEMVREFHAAFAPDTEDPEAARDVRSTLLAEEHAEVQIALHRGPRVALARELADLVYVAYGTALVHGIDLDAALAEVHRANMTKLGPGGQPILRDDGKVLPGPNYQPPDLSVALDKED